ncbi:hypothetical protein ACQUUA_14305, partial [Pseudomonas aeruginosa]|uniref:hypothetical protein n=1 Tax=Pseudomonas aeruginosa TaxID=287 RepID=UPI003D1836E5
TPYMRKPTPPDADAAPGVNDRGAEDRHDPYFISLLFLPVFQNGAVRVPPGALASPYSTAAPRRGQNRRKPGG